MKLEEAIKNFEQEIGEFEGFKKINAVTYEDYERIEKTRRLAEWLKELKERREQDVPDTNVGDMISRQAVIKAVDKFIPADPMKNDYTQGISVGLAIATRCIEEFSQETDESSQGLVKDLISKQAAIEIIQSMYPGMPRVPWMRKYWQKRHEPYIRMENAIRELSSARPAPCEDDKGCSNCMYSGRPTYKSPCSECHDNSQWEMEPISRSHENSTECEDVVSRRKLLNDLGELITAWEKYPVMAEQIKGVKAAIEYVETIPSVTLKPDHSGNTTEMVEYDDCVSRQAVADVAYEVGNLFDGEDDTRTPYGVAFDIQMAVDKLPSVTPKRKTGRWIEEQRGIKVTLYRCSECGRAVIDDTSYDAAKDFPFCHCGADMRQREEE